MKSPDNWQPLNGYRLESGFPEMAGPKRSAPAPRNQSVELRSERNRKTPIQGDVLQKRLLERES